MDKKTPEEREALLDAAAEELAHLLIATWKHVQKKEEKGDQSSSGENNKGGTM